MKKVKKKIWQMKQKSSIILLLVESVRDMVRAKYVSDASKCIHATIRTLPTNTVNTDKVDRFDSDIRVKNSNLVNL